jgi:hypothetical protein
MSATPHLDALLAQATPVEPPIFCHSEFNKDYLAEMDWGIIHCSSFRIPFAEFKRRATEANAAPALRAALQETTEECEQLLKDIGGCDHSVGICCCELIAKIGRARAALSALDAAAKERT